jgi:hypothetical protein
MAIWYTLWPFGIFSTVWYFVVKKSGNPAKQPFTFHCLPFRGRLNWPKVSTVNRCWKSRSRLSRWSHLISSKTFGSSSLRNIPFFGSGDACAIGRDVFCTNEFLFETFFYISSCSTKSAIFPKKNLNTCCKRLFNFFLAEYEQCYSKRNSFWKRRQCKVTTKSLLEQNHC